MRGFPTRQSGLHSSVWPGLVLILVALGLLWAFLQVTRGVVQQSELRLQSLSVHNKATWHCNSLSGQIARENCLSQRGALVNEANAHQP